MEKNNAMDLVFIVDNSGSMSGLENDTVGGFNSTLERLREEEGSALVTTVLFNTDFKVLHNRVDIKEVAPLTRNDYRTGGGTALLDAIGRTMGKIRDAQEKASEDKKPSKALFVIITDGEENSSREFSSRMIKERIEHSKEIYGWDFIFIGANMDAITEAKNIGIDFDRAVNYVSDRKGTEVAWDSIACAAKHSMCADLFSMSDVFNESKAKITGKKK